jgi:hypothetical protein
MSLVYLLLKKLSTIAIIMVLKPCGANSIKSISRCKVMGYLTAIQRQGLKSLLAVLYKNPR